MSHGHFHVPRPHNEPVLAYAPGSPELRARLGELAREEVEIPPVIGGREVRTGTLADARAPHRHAQRLARWHQAGAPEVESAVRAAREARGDWAAMPFHQRAAIFLRAADRLSGGWRPTLNGATMLGQSKTPSQAEIDSASGTNDKAGSMWNLIRWVSPRAIKENLAPPAQVEYPHQAEKE